MKRMPVLLCLLPALLLCACAPGAEAPAAPTEAPAAPTEAAVPTEAAAPPEPAPGTEAGGDAMPSPDAGTSAGASPVRLLYQGHASLRFTAETGEVIYVDPYAGEGYERPVDLILITHFHSDHAAINKLGERKAGCTTITSDEALEDGVYKTFELDYVTVEAVQAGNNPNHDLSSGVGYILTFKSGVTVYISGDTSTTEQMSSLAERNLDYALFCCDGNYNMDLEEAAACAELVGAKHNIPYHLTSGAIFDAERAEGFDAPNRLILADGEEIELSAE